MFTPLRSIAEVSLGYKSLQNNFFYVNKATISTYGIEKKFLIPILMLRDLNASTFGQVAKPSHWLFACRAKREDLRGTGAWRYIEAMGDRSAAEKKQSGKRLTIREALEAQSGGLWYAPKAKPAVHNIWLRKAFNTVYAPFVFAKPVLVDQRLNNIDPVKGVQWKELAAVLTSSVFAYGLEINGAASMGAGALEAPTTKLSDYPVLDVRQLKSPQRKKLVSLASDVWAKEEPLDWGSVAWKPGKKLRALDDWLLSAAGSSVTTSQMYEDIRGACLARIAVAADKKTKAKKRETDSITSVADSIVSSVERKLSVKSFPDDFVHRASLDLPFTFDRNSLKQITIDRLLDNYDIQVLSKGGKVEYSASHPRPIAEAIVRALLMGRSTFSVSTDRQLMDRALDDFLAWLRDVEIDVQAAIAESAFGTGYEDDLKREIYLHLGIHPLSGTPTLPQLINL